MTPEILRDLFTRALEEEMGVVISTNNPHGMSLRLHAFRKANPQFAEIEITVPSLPETVMLVKKSVELDEPVYGEPDLD